MITGIILGAAMAIYVGAEFTAENVIDESSDK